MSTSPDSPHQRNIIGPKLEVGTHAIKGFKLWKIIISKMCLLTEFINNLNQLKFWEKPFNTT